MPAKSSEQLPSGWTVQFKVQKTGRKIKYYMNLGTGQKFFSKEDLLQYVKMERTLHESKPTSGCSRRRIENSNIKPVAKENECHEWLPDGWIVDLKTRKSGSLIGRTYKIYTDPLTGWKFFSKPEVLRYLESVKHKSCTSKRKKTHNDACSASKVVVKKSAEDDLPPGWIKKMKIRTTAYGIRKDPYYSDPVSGYIFRSKKDVFRYLETGEISRHAFKPAKRDVNHLEAALSPPAAKTQILEHTATRRRLFPVEERSEACSSALPEADALKKRRGKSDETGLAGATTAEISPEIMVIEKGPAAKETSSSAMPKRPGSKRNQGKMAFADYGPVSTPATDSQRGKNFLERGMECSSRKLLNNSKKSEQNKKLNLPRRSSKRLAGLEPELVVGCVSIEWVPKKATAESCKSEAIPTVSLTSNGLADEITKKLNTGPVMEDSNCVSSEANIPSNGEQSNKIKPSSNETILRQKMKMLKSAETNDDKSEPHLPFSLGNSNLEPCLEFTLTTLTGEILVDVIPDNGPVSTPAADILQGKSLQETKAEKSSDRKTESNLIKSKKIKELNLPRRSSKRLAGLEPELVPNSMFSERALVNATRKSSESKASVDAGLCPNGLGNGASQLLEAGHVTTLAHHDSTDISTPLHEESSTNSKKPLELQTVSEEQPQKLESDWPEGQPQQLESNKPEGQSQELESEKMNNENSESLPLFPFAECWSDPCLEFAFKTLTGAIPVDDHLAIQDYFQHQLDMSRTQTDKQSALPDYGLPGCFQTDVSFQFDAPEKQIASQQQLPVNPSFLPSGNVSFPSCSSIASQQPCLEGKKDLHGKVKS